MVKTKLFFGSFAVTLCVLLTLFFINRPLSAKLQQISDHVFVTAQLQMKDIGKLANQRIMILVDLRPDGEARDQPSSTAIKNAAEQLGLKFFYPRAARKYSGHSSRRITRCAI